MTRRWLGVLVIAVCAGCKSTAGLTPSTAQANRTGRPPVVGFEAQLPPPASPRSGPSLLEFDQIDYRTAARQIRSSATDTNTPSGFIAGKIVGPNGRPLRDVTVIVTAPAAATEPPRRVTVDSRGWFYIDALTPGQRYLLVVTGFDTGQTYLARASVVAPRDRILITARPDQADTPGTGERAIAQRSAEGSRLAAQPAMPGPQRTSTRRPGRPADALNAGGGQGQSASRGPGLREFVSRLFGRRSPNPTMAAPPTAAFQDSPPAGGPPRRPLAELPIPGFQGTRVEPRQRGPRPVQSRAQPPPPRLAGSVRPGHWRPVRRPVATTAKRSPTSAASDRNDDRGSPQSPFSSFSSEAVARTRVRRPVRTPPAEPPAIAISDAPLVNKTTSPIGTDTAASDGRFLATVAGGSLRGLALPDARLRMVRLDELDGELMLLDFWASWCGACLRAMPAIERLHRDYYGRGLRVVGVAYEQGPLPQQAATVREVAQRLQTTYPLLLGGADHQDLLRRTFQVRVFPTLVLLDRRGRLLWRSDGFDPSEFERLRGILKRRLSR